jgi:hypothetical protein
MGPDQLAPVADPVAYGPYVVPPPLWSAGCRGSLFNLEAVGYVQI